MRYTPRAQNVRTGNPGVERDTVLEPIVDGKCPAA
jgi:hypothetical protein